MTKPRTLLLIDDNPDDSEFYQELLQRCSNPYRVIIAESGEEGIKLFKQHHIDCAIIDYNLPEMNGLHILAELNKAAEGNIAAIILTGEPHQTVQAEAARKGALDYIVKDACATPEKVQAIIEKTIEWASQADAEASTLLKG